MRIAVTSPPWIPLPPYGYGGIERVVTNLTEGLVKKGHQVTLFATGDSQTSAKLEYLYHHALGNHLDLKLNPYFIVDHIYHFYKNTNHKFDIIHDNSSELALYFADMVTTPTVTTLHGTYIDGTKDLLDKYRFMNTIKKTLTEFKHKPFVSISDTQRKGLPDLNYIKTIYNSIILHEFDFNQLGGKNMVWMGRINYTKGVDLGIEAAEKTKHKLVLASYLDHGDIPYYKTEIESHFANKIVSNIGEMKNKKTKSKFLGNAKLFLFPIRWDEPFGIVMIEAMATGTPVIAYALGSVPEVIKDGQTGFIVNASSDDIRGNWIVKKTGVQGLCEAVERIYSLPQDKYLEMRKACRSHVEKHFTVDTMVDKYIKVFEEVISKHKK